MVCGDSVNEESVEVDLKTMDDAKSVFGDKKCDCTFGLLKIDQGSFSQSPLFKFRVEFEVQNLEYPNDESKLQSLVVQLQKVVEDHFEPVLDLISVKVVGIEDEPMSFTLLIEMKELTELIDMVEWRQLGFTVIASMKVILSYIVFLIDRLGHYCTEFSIVLLKMRFNQGPSTREDELNWKRRKYKLRVSIPGIPPQCSKIPREEQFSFIYNMSSLLHLGVNTVRGRLCQCACSTSRIKSTTQYKGFIKRQGYSIPSDMNRWKKDSAFGVQRFAGINNTTIRRCTWDNFPEIAIDKDLKWVRDGIAEKSLYFVDHSILKGIKEGYDVAPIALFSMKTGQLLPVAIQLFPNQPVFTPDDSKYTWIMAKMWFNNADAQVHQAVCHLGFTHLIMGGIVVVTHRQLAPAHPVLKLLAPHFLYLIAINDLAATTLLSPTGFIDTEMSIGLDGSAKLIQRKRELWCMDVDGTLPEDLKSRGIDDQIQGYHFQEDGLQLYAAMQNYVRNYLNIYYTNSITIANDVELQAWRSEMTTPEAKGGLGINGVPGKDGRFTETEQIVTTLTSIIYTCSVGHAAANFKQYDEYAFAPNYPLKLRGYPPTVKGVKLREKDIFDAIPDKSSISEVLAISDVLSQRGTKALGDFEVKYIYDERTLPVVDGFCQDLKQIDLEIKRKNVDREIPYPYLQPSDVPNSISI